jgi:hypothetical protein
MSGASLLTAGQRVSVSVSRPLMTDRSQAATKRSYLKPAAATSSGAGA